MSSGTERELLTSWRYIETRLVDATARVMNDKYYSIYLTTNSSTTVLYGSHCFFVQLGLAAGTGEVHPRYPFFHEGVFDATQS